VVGKLALSRVNPIRVLLIAPSLDIVGGQSIQAQRLMQGFRAHPDIDIAFQPIDPKLTGFWRALQKPKYLRTVVTELIYVLQVIRSSFDRDVLHLFTAGFWSFYLTSIPALSVAKVRRKPCILHYHDGRASDHIARFPNATRWIKRANLVVVPSDFLVDVFAKIGIRSLPISNTISIGQFRFRERRQPRPVFLHNRGLETHYNVACCLRAFSLIQEHHPEAKLFIAHDGPDRGNLERLSRKLDLKHVFFLGAVSQDQMQELYDTADIYLMSPNIDNMPLSVLECFAAGLPVVSTNAGGIPRIVENNRTGLLVPSNDHGAMAEASLRLLREEGLASRLTGNAREECRRYEASVIACQWVSLYHELSSRQQA
jgi:glycosyltransferase involved in cell wall biosynthesis